MVRKNEWITCDGRGEPSTKFPDGYPLMHDVAKAARDIMVGDPFNWGAFSDWQGCAPPASADWKTRPLPPGCPFCSGKWYDPATGAYHVEYNWRDRPIGYAPERKEFATMVELVNHNAAAMMREPSMEELALAYRMDAEIAAASAAPPTWWARFRAACVRLAQRLYSALMRFGHHP